MRREAERRGNKGGKETGREMKQERAGREGGGGEGVMIDEEAMINEV